MIDGTFDVFGELENHIRVFLDISPDAPDTLVIGVLNLQESSFVFRAHAEFFNEPPIAATDGVLLTRVATTDGRRLGSTVIETQHTSELNGVRVTSRGFALGGRVLSEVRSDGSGWNAFTALVGRDGILNSYNLVDVDQGDVLFDIAELPSGRFLALGTTGYIQNPTGESVSEATKPLLVVLNSDGSFAQNLAYAGGARQNQLTTIAPRNGGWLLAGMVNGPGTHSGDANRGLIVAEGFVREGSNLPAQ